MLTYMEYCLALNTFLKFTNQQNLYLFPSQVTLFTDIQRETFEPQGPIRMFLFTTDQYSGNIKRFIVLYKCNELHPIYQNGDKRL